MPTSAVRPDILQAATNKGQQRSNRYGQARSFLTRTLLRAPEHIKVRFNGGVYEAPRAVKAYCGESNEVRLADRLRQQQRHDDRGAVQSFLEQVPDRSSVLNVPFGDGRFVDLYLEKAMKVFGVEQSPKMIEIAKKTLDSQFDRCDVQARDALSLPFYRNTFDLVVSFGFISRVVTYDQAVVALEEFHRVTSRFAIFQIGEREPGCYRRRSPKGHETMASWLYPSEVEELLAGIGFQVLDKTEPMHGTLASSTNGNHDWRAYFCFKIP